MEKRATTKEKILYILKKDGEVSMKELAAHFTISEIAVRKHVAELLRQEFIQERQEKQAIGRPFYLYSLTKKGHQTFPNQYEELPLQILEDLETMQGKTAVDDLLLVRKEREQLEYEEQLPFENFDDKVRKVVELQKNKGYMIEYDQTERGDYEIKNFNCPIYNVATNYTQICDNEKVMYEKLFPGSEVTVKSSLARGKKYCHWKITRPK